MVFAVKDALTLRVHTGVYFHNDPLQVSTAYAAMADIT